MVGIGANLENSMATNHGKNTWLKQLGILFAIATEITYPPLGGFLLGYFLDKYFQTGPWLAMVFLVLGVVVGVINVFRYSRRFRDKW